MNELIIYTRADGGVSTVAPAKGNVSLDWLQANVVPADAINVRRATLADIPSTRLYRNAWDDSNPESFIGVNMVKAKEMAHGRRRDKRDEVFKPHLDITSKAAQGIPLKAGEDAVTSQQAMTNYKATVDDVAQAAIDAAIDADELMAIELANNFVQPGDI